ncbi:MAG: tRNA (N6-isopentenyl adenosine(37)-C2)-methylthiotransferase MiaB [Deltaproteobacteria bacterium]|nr:MAG: tRNA (N6-isopentenyl adenosine(37)-C2)-methylthiotransferase MiaB [Deltaproteobacteria bacterium]
MPPPQPDRNPTRVYVETYGCQMNVADSDLIAGLLADEGFAAVSAPDQADIILLNTCAVREKAEERIYGRASQLLRFKYTNPNLLIGVLGCMAEHLKERIAENAPHVDLIVGPDAYRRLPDLLRQAGSATDPVIDVRLDKGETYEGLRPAAGGGISGFVTIQRGCDKFCTFCIVPYTRGRERGTAPREVLRQVRDLAAMGYREVTLLGQTVNSYRHEDSDFADLLRAVHEVSGIERIRYTSPYPVDFSTRLVRTLAELPKVCNSLHLPLQSGSDVVLERMRRGYTVSDFRRIVDELREHIPDISISTDIIVGFPDETEEQFEETLSLMRDVRFDSAFMFAYSEREGTYASKRIADSIPEAVKKERLARLIRQQESIGAERHARWVGRSVRVLAEGPSRRDPRQWFGRSEDFKSVIFDPPAGIRAGDLVDIVVQRATSHTLIATGESAVSSATASA